MARGIPRKSRWHSPSYVSTLILLHLSLSLLAPDQAAKTRDISIIGIHPLKNRLFRILLNSHAQKMQSACASIPLIDGMVIPLHLLPFFLRQAVHNLSRRKRLEDSQRFVTLPFFSNFIFLFSSQTAYSLRKTRLTKIIEKYHHRTNDHLDEFFRTIFFSPSHQQPLTTPSNSRTNSMIVVQS